MSFENKNNDFDVNGSAPAENTAAENAESSEVIIDMGPLFEEDKTESAPEAVSDGSEVEISETATAEEEDTATETAPTSSSYEWSSENGYEAVVPMTDKKSEKKKKKSFNGFRAFLAVVLTVFTVSVIAMTVMVADFIDDREDERERNAFVSTSGSSKDNSDRNESKKPVYGGAVSANASDLIVHDNGGEHLTIPQIAAKCSPSSVGIISEVEVTYGSSFFPFSVPSTGVSQATGSGFIYSADGYVITNHHVIEDAKKITVVLHDKTELEATLVGSDSLSDIAVLKVTPTEGISLIPMEIGNSDELVVGEAVVAIGCPAGIEFLGTVTDGIVSSINRDVQVSDNNASGSKTMTLIQTNATINQGNSGGPLINTRGQVIGINTLKLASNYEGIGFSIPMNGATPIISQLIEHGRVIERTEEDFAYGKGLIGINGSAISEDEAEYYGIPRGVLVVQINRESSAARAGLRRGDIITHYNGKEVKTVDEINEAKGNARAGETVTVTVYRDGSDGKGESVDITFKLDAQ